MTRSRRLPGVLFALFGLLGNAQSATAQTFTWNVDTSGSWNSAANWDPTTVPNGQGVGVVFGNVITANRTVSLDSDVTVGSIAFENTGLFSYTIGGSAIITLDNGASPASISVAPTSLTGQTINRHLIAANDVAITNNSLTAFLTLQGGISLGGRSLTVNGPGTTVFSSNPITGSGTGKLVQSGPGRVFLSSINNGIRYEVNGGTLFANAANALQPINPGILTPDLITLTNGGTINFLVQQTQRDFTGITLGAGGGGIASEAAAPVILSAPITGAGSLTKTGPQTIALAAVSNYTGETIIREGALRIDVNAFGGSPGALGNATSPVILGDNVGANSTALYIGVNGVSIGRDITVVASPAPGASTVTIGIRPADVFSTVSGSFSGPLTLNRSVILSVIGGTGSTANFGRITGTGGITIAGAGIVTFNSSLSDFVGTITLDSGTLSINDDAKLGAPSNAILFDSSTLRITGSTPFSTNRAITLLSSGVSGSKIDVLNSDPVSGFTIASAITGAGPLIKRGPGILTLSGANTHGLSTIVEAGTLQVTGPNVLSPNSTVGVFAGATVKLNGFSQQVARIMDGSPSSFGTIDLGSNPATVLTVGRDGISKQPILFQGQIVGQGDLVFTGLGSQWMGGTSSYFGTTTVRQGNLDLHAPVPASGNGPLGNAAGGAVRLGDANLSSLDAALVNFDKSSGGFARPITVVAGAGQRTIGHRLHGATHDNSIITFSGPIALEKDLFLYSLTTLDYVGSDLRVSGAVSGTGGLIKIGGGEARLTADNTYAGSTIIQNGRLLIGGLGLPNAAARSSSGFIVGTDWNNPGIPLDTPHFPAPTDRNLAEFLIQDFSPNANRIGDVDVTISQGKFSYLGQNAGASSESFRNLIVERGASTLELLTPIHANTTSATFSMTGGLDRQNRGTLRVNSTGLGNPDGGDFTRILAASSPALVGGGGAAGSTNISILPWAYHGMGPDVVPSWNFLTYGPTGLRLLTAPEYASSLTAVGDLNNVRVTATATTLNQNQTINSLSYDLAAGGTITLTGQTLAVNSGAILSRSNLLTLNGGALDFGAAEGIIHSTDFSDVTITSAISGSNGLTSHLGFGSTLALNGVNTYTGPTTINSGNVAFNSAASFGSGADPIRLRWGWTLGTGNLLTYTGTGATTLAKPIEIGPSTNEFRISTGSTLTLTGVISGAGIDPLNDAVSFNSLTGTFELRAANTFTGNVRLIAGTVGIVADNNFGPTTNRLTLSNGSGNIATLRFDAAGIEIARPITVGGHSNLRTTGTDAVISGPISGAEYPTILTKVGAGTLTLTGTHAYGATTHVSGGTLAVNGTLAGGFQTGLVHVNNSGTLGGNGTINRLVRVNTGGTLAPGAGVGTLTLGALEFNANATATYLWEAGASAQDQIVVTSGPVNLSGITVTLGLFDRGLGTGVTPEMQFPLLTVAGVNSITGFDPAKFTVIFADTPNWTTGQLSLNVVELGGNTSLVLSNISPVPEPASVLAIAGIALGLSTWNRRRGRSRRPTAGDFVL